ncbi:MAG: tRNA (adenosine(37)-N6)-dimethylallyltransferase MiaA [Gemmatimonadota bacterium]|nr:tRNA (adenosine(37)-N6)-dimethylallyltransferase MiaA [Gemmatimonadota bacterium]
MAGSRALVPVLVGPTAVGKTAVALALRQHWNLVVISADSRQVYRGLDIGTAKPSAEERTQVPHRGIDVVEPGHRYSAGQFARDAAEWLREVGDTQQPVVVGGTGFYVRALADGLFREPPIDRERRDRFRSWAKHASGLGQWAVRLDAGYRGGGRQRAERAVEIALLTGRSLSWWQATTRARGIMRPWYIRLTVPRVVLRRRIERRAREMLEHGLVREVRDILDRGVAPDAPGLDAVGYREVTRHLLGGMAADELLTAIVVATRRYAKRQETWFRHQLVGHPVLTLDATDEATLLADRIAELWEERGN